MVRLLPLPCSPPTQVIPHCPPPALGGLKIPSESQTGNGNGDVPRKWQRGVEGSTRKAAARWEHRVTGTGIQIGPRTKRPQPKTWQVLRPTNALSAR